VGIQCPICRAGHTFYVALVWGKNEGWFAPVKDVTNGSVYIPMDMSDPRKPHTSAVGVAMQVAKVPEDEQIPIRI
jgi:hypothetical protein